MQVPAMPVESPAGANPVRDADRMPRAEPADQEVSPDTTRMRELKPAHDEARTVLVTFDATELDTMEPGADLGHAPLTCRDAASRKVIAVGQLFDGRCRFADSGRVDGQVDPRRAGARELRMFNITLRTSGWMNVRPRPVKPSTS